MYLDQEISVPWKPIPKGKNKRQYSRYLLIDGKVFSTSETLAKLCKQTGFATLIGEPTRGEGNAFTPYKLVLCDQIDTDEAVIKGIYLNFPTDAPVNENGEIDYERFYNTSPDIECPSEQALEVALNLIRQNEKHR